MKGETVSHYRIGRKLGEGGMGAVYEAEDTRLGRVVALKFLPRELLQDRDARARFEQEARAAAAVDHPNLCAVYDIDKTPDGRLYIVMARYEGRTLAEKIRDGPIAIDAALEIAAQAAGGLAAMHARGIVHRDLKPGNVMVTPEGQVKILDFGLAQLAGATRITRAGTAVGTVSYMSPEQAQGAPVDHRADVWALGAMLYEMVTGRPPFRGNHAQAVIRSVLNDTPVPVTQLRSDAPPELEAVLAKCLEKKADERFRDIREFMSALDASSASLRSEEATVDLPARGPRPSKRHGLYLVALSAVLGAAVVAGALLMLRRDAPEPSAGPTRIASVAVLPLSNLMGDEEQDYFVDGLHDALITSLAKVRSLKVISRTSTMRYRDTEKSIPEIARELDVDALVEGSVLRDSDRIRVTAQLIDGANDTHLWAESYDRDLEDTLTLVSEVAREIATEIEAALTPEEEELLTRRTSVGFEAQEEYLRGRHAFNRLGEGVREAISHFDRAIALEPGFAAALAVQANAYVALGVFGEEPWRNAAERARSAANAALALDADLPEAHTAMGWVRLYVDWDWEGSEASFQRALELNPSNALARHGFGDLLAVTGRSEASLEQVILGSRADPLALAAVGPVAFHLWLAGHYDEAVVESRAVSKRFPPIAGTARWVEAAALWGKGSERESVEMLRDLWSADDAMVEALDRGLRLSPADAMRAAAELLASRAERSDSSAGSIADLFARAGDAPEAIAWLDRALEDRRPTGLHAFASPSFDPFRGRPEFRVVEERLGLR